MKRHLMTTKLAKRAIYVIWAIALVISTGWLFGFKSKLVYSDQPDIYFCTEDWGDPVMENYYFGFVSLGFGFIVPLFVLLTCYVTIYLTVCTREIPGNSQDDGEKKRHRSKMKVIKMCLCVVCLFLASWFPTMAITARLKFSFRLTDREYEWYPYLYPIGQFLGNLNACINPFMYAFMNKKFQAAFRHLIWAPNWFKKYRNNDSINNTTSSTYRSLRQISSEHERNLKGPLITQGSLDTQLTERARHLNANDKRSVFCQDKSLTRGSLDDRKGNGSSLNKKLINRQKLLLKNCGKNTEEMYSTRYVIDKQSNSNGKQSNSNVTPVEV